MQATDSTDSGLLSFLPSLAKLASPHSKNVRNLPKLYLLSPGKIAALGITKTWVSKRSPYPKAEFIIDEVSLLN